MYHNNYNQYSCITYVTFLLLLFTDHCCPSSNATSSSSNDTCSILCSGDILKQVQLANIFNESKYFVDMKLLGKPFDIQEEFDVLFNNSAVIEPSLLKGFVDKWFDPPGSDLVKVKPKDFVRVPRFLLEISDPYLRDYLKELIDIWYTLLRETPEDVKNQPELYSHIYLPHPFIIPGGRFREIYYWDSYWIIEGLLLSEMDVTAKEMIENLLYLVKQYGYVPNGSRKYYIGRSQIPFLISTMNMYYSYTNDFDFIEENIHLLDTEYQYWIDNNLVNFEHNSMNHSLFHYVINSTTPRPESYSQDYTMAQHVSAAERKHFYGDIKAAAESGWDFSSRWFVAENGTVSENINDIYTQVIVPVDLNSLMCYNARILSTFYQKIGNNRSHHYDVWATSMNHSISRLLWDDSEGFWFDYNLKTKDLRKGFYGSSFMPLWTKTYGVERNNTYVVSKVIEYMLNNNLTSYPGGLPTSLDHSNQQWDLPNGWAPLHYIAVLGLQNAAVYNETAGKFAFDIASKWVINNYVTYENNTPHVMMEKYDVTQVGSPGHGGFYEVQEGFGWTNGVVMKLCDIYHSSIYVVPKRYPVMGYIVGIVLTVVIVVSYTLFSRAKKDDCVIEATPSLLEDEEGEGGAQG